MRSGQKGEVRRVEGVAGVINSPAQVVISAFNRKSRIHALFPVFM